MTPVNDDLIGRLREEARRQDIAHSGNDPETELLREAADALEAQEKERQRQIDRTFRNAEAAESWMVEAKALAEKVKRLGWAFRENMAFEIAARECAEARTERLREAGNRLRKELDAHTKVCGCIGAIAAWDALTAAGAGSERDHIGDHEREVMDEKRRDET